MLAKIFLDHEPKTESTVERPKALGDRLFDQTDQMEIFGRSVCSGSESTPSRHDSHGMKRKPCPSTGDTETQAWVAEDRSHEWEVPRVARITRTQMNQEGGRKRSELWKQNLRTFWRIDCVCKQAKKHKLVCSAIQTPFVRCSFFGVYDRTFRVVSWLDPFTSLGRLEPI